MAVYLNTYQTYQAYGGPEEGGWWYECGDPIQSLKVSEEDLGAMEAERDKKYEHWQERYFRLLPCYREELDPARKERISNILDRIDKVKDKLWSSGRLSELRQMARKVTEAIKQNKPIESYYKETGGYGFVIDLPDCEDPRPTEYRGDDRYVTYVEGEFAQFFPQEKPYYC
jgi:hypothetical protein